MESSKKVEKTSPVGGLAGWLLKRLRPVTRTRPSLELVSRINLAPRQCLALVEADGRRVLVAMSADGAPAFYALDDRNGTRRLRGARPSTSRTPW